MAVIKIKTSSANPATKFLPSHTTVALGALASGELAYSFSNDILVVGTGTLAANATNSTNIVVNKVIGGSAFFDEASLSKTGTGDNVLAISPIIRGLTLGTNKDASGNAIAANVANSEVLTSITGYSSITTTPVAGTTLGKELILKPNSAGSHTSALTLNSSYTSSGTLHTLILSTPVDATVSGLMSTIEIKPSSGTNAGALKLTANTTVSGTFTTNTGAVQFGTAGATASSSGSVTFNHLIAPSFRADNGLSFRDATDGAPLLMYVVKGESASTGSSYSTILKLPFLSAAAEVEDFLATRSSAETLLNKSFTDPKIANITSASNITLTPNGTGGKVDIASGHAFNVLGGSIKVTNTTLPQLTLTNTATEYLTIGHDATGGTTFTSNTTTAAGVRTPFKFLNTGLNSPYLDTQYIRGAVDNSVNPPFNEYTLVITAGDITVAADNRGASGLTGGISAVNINAQKFYTTGSTAPANGGITASGVITAGSFTTTGSITAASIETAKLFIGTTQVNLNSASATVTALAGMTSIAVGQLSGSPTLANEITSTDASNRIANKGYVDAVAQGLHIHAPADLILIGPLSGAIVNEASFAYDNGISGVGATITITANANTTLTFTIDSTTVAQNNRIVITGETFQTALSNTPNQTWHGIYTVTTFTSAVNASIVLTRAVDADTMADLSGGDFIFVTSGTVYADSGFVQTTNSGSLTLGSTFMPAFVQFSSAGDIIAGNGLTKSGGAISINLTANGGLAITNDSIGINSTLVGTGLTLSSGVITVNSVNLTTGVTGTLPVANGGTGSGTALTQYSVLYASASTTAGSTNAGAANTVLTGTGTAPSFSATPTLSRLTLTDTAVTAGATLAVAPNARTSNSGVENTSGITVGANTLTITAGPIANQRFNVFNAPTISGAFTVTQSATVAITGAPIASGSTLSSNFALLVESGDVLFKGLIKAGNGATPTTLTNAAGVVLANAGGTGLTSYAVGDLLYAGTTTSLTKLSVQTAGYILGGGTIPTWTTTPQVSTLNLLAANNQITFGTTNIGTLTWTPTATKTIILPDIAGTVHLIDGNQSITSGTWNAGAVTSSGGLTVTAGAATFNHASGISFRDFDNIPISAYVIRPNEVADVDTHVSTILLPRCTNTVTVTVASTTAAGGGGSNTLTITGSNAIFPVGSVITGAGISVTGSVVTTTGGNPDGFSTIGLSANIPFTISNYTITFAIDTLAVLGSTGQTFTGGPSFTISCPSSTITPTLDTHIANKAYVDSVAQGLHVHPPVRVATTVNLAVASYTWVAGNGNLTLSAALTVLDGVTLAVNDRILVKDQTVPAYNGIYYYSNTTLLIRTLDANQISDLSGGDFVFVVEGTTFADCGFVQTSQSTTEFHTTTGPNITFAQFSQAGVIEAGAGLTKSGNSLSVSSITHLTAVGTISTGTIDGGTF